MSLRKEASQQGMAGERIRGDAREGKGRLGGSSAGS